MEHLVPSDFEALDGLVEAHTFNDTLTNTYLLSSEYQKYIDTGKLTYWAADGNLYLFVEKEGFYRLYYLINNPSAVHDFSGLALVLEIIYRGSAGPPVPHIEFWKKNGFVTHLVRDCYFLRSNQINLQYEKRNEIEVLPIKNEKDITFAKKLIDQYLDFYTGDRLTLPEMKEIAEQGLLYCGYTNGIPCGILHADLRNNVFWLGHIVVDEKHRGLGIANQLVDYYLMCGLEKKVNQFQLWVINDNEPAVNLYKRKGFQYQNKSTYSMLKID